ncbi:acyl-CoA dehydrogenase family protein [Thiomonas sp.]|uniref:acyl-CoA dehydrogenase family protein n=1 Tax=Thiomonas sp. TaxID=2047785 RepID=UPI0026243B43|nr:acyl-CoA dehydrogenase family protein [Thiomonas sp.]
MPDLDEALARARYGPTWLGLASVFRSISWEIVERRDIVMEVLGTPGFDAICADRSSTCAERACMYEVLAYGDPGALLACPGPSLSGIVLRELGTSEQMEHFFSFVARERARTCMAVTEPARGSDAGDPTTILLPDGRIRGEKWMVGNGRDARIGTMLVRTGPGPCNVGLLLLLPEVLEHPSVSRRVLPMAGLAGAGLSQLRFDDTPVSREHQLLGQHRRALERGMHAVIRTFDRMRPCVSAMALGSAQAMLDFALPHLSNAVARDLHGALQRRVDAVRALNRDAAEMVDRQDLGGAAISLAKACATELVECVADGMPWLVGTETFLIDPWLQKTIVDVRGYEWMEGSVDMQRFNALSGFIRSMRRCERSVPAAVQVGAR